MGINVFDIRLGNDTPLLQLYFVGIFIISAYKQMNHNVMPMAGSAL